MSYFKCEGCNKRNNKIFKCCKYCGLPNPNEPICKSVSEPKPDLPKVVLDRLNGGKVCSGCSVFKLTTEFIPRSSKCYICRQIDQIVYTRQNKDKINSLAGLRKKRVREATPNWLTKEHRKQIEKLYLKSYAMGEGYHVDHMIPIKGKNICGLHVPWNLEIIPAKDNLSKGNKVFHPISAHY